MTGSSEWPFSGDPFEITAKYICSVIILQSRYSDALSDGPGPKRQLI